MNFKFIYIYNRVFEQVKSFLLRMKIFGAVFCILVCLVLSSQQHPLIDSDLDQNSLPVRTTSDLEIPAVEVGNNESAKRVLRQAISIISADGKYAIIYNAQTGQVLYTQKL